jgi:hypothetical protein
VDGEGLAFAIRDDKNLDGALRTDFMRQCEVLDRVVGDGRMARGGLLCGQARAVVGLGRGGEGVLGIGVKGGWHGVLRWNWEVKARERDQVRRDHVWWNWVRILDALRLRDATSIDKDGARARAITRRNRESLHDRGSW